MVGFSLKPKDDAKPTKGGFGGFSLKKKQAANAKLPIKKPTQFGKHEDDDEVKEVKIDTFDSEKGGAFHKDHGPEKPKGPLVIENSGNQNWRQIARERFNPTSQQAQEVTSKKLEYGINFIEHQEKHVTTSDGPKLSKRDVDDFKKDVESRPDEATLEQYEEIPVEDFGSAMLRGMGWKGPEDTDKKEKKEVIPLVKRTPHLGLGAKSISDTDSKKPIDKSYVPVKKVDRRTGQVIDEKPREKSPNRGAQNYRSRN